MSCAALLDGNAQPKSMSRARQWTDVVENLYRFQEAGYRDELEYRQIKQVEIDRWPETGFVKKLQRRDNTFYYYSRKRECEDRDVYKVKVRFFFLAEFSLLESLLSIQSELTAEDVLLPKEHVVPALTQEENERREEHGRLHPTDLWHQWPGQQTSVRRDFGKGSDNQFNNWWTCNSTNDSDHYQRFRLPCTASKATQHFLCCLYPADVWLRGGSDLLVQTRRPGA
ncbi:hypothetical protein AMELA_G00182470 [Ameiurus melas]|uniref:Meiosis expressed gene 1 protein homolog n=1 Tax=Ameiurus melas TaxID=219545 RepID=A0A7J6AAJ3_AMEME|nr:hypothetical protein AMELA_G00182470 [Ameiurus melas]